MEKQVHKGSYCIVKHEEKKSTTIKYSPLTEGHNHERSLLIKVSGQIVHKKGCRHTHEDDAPIAGPLVEW